MDQYTLADDLKEFFLPPISSTFRLGSAGNNVLDLLSAYDIMKDVGVNSGHKTKLDKFKLISTGNGIVLSPILAKWEDYKISSMFGPSAPMLTLESAKSLVCYILRRNAKSQDEVKQILERYGIPASQFESSVASQPEKDTIGMIQRAIPFESIPQFNLGEYRIDLYFPDLNIAVECDENNHAAYDQCKEITRYNFIRKHLRCEILRYDPYAVNFSVCDTIRTIIERILAPQKHYQTEERKECGENTGSN
uniref:DUF559 domain-containing protein n=1 Tax=viral metagenome TaxID=1070528 RepID=A0A6C0CJW5_9ZZZZ